MFAGCYYLCNGLPLPFLQRVGSHTKWIGHACVQSRDRFHNRQSRTGVVAMPLAPL